jgi:hypothetical protein
MSATTTTAAPRELVRIDGSAAFAWANALLGLAFTLGVMVDIWAHSNVRPLFETFFTVWHALLYGGFAVMAAFLVISAGRARASGAPLARVLPAGYLLSGVGVLVFASGGAFDMGWHMTFGIESGNDALVSPSHLLLALGGVLIVSGPLRARTAPAGARVVSATATLLFLLPFLTIGAGPFGDLTAVNTRGESQELQILGVLTYIALIVGVLLYALRRGPLPFGAVLATAGVAGVVAALIGSRSLGADRDLMLALAVGTALLGDVLLALLRAGPGRPARTRAFAALLPVAILAPYLATLWLRFGLTWSVHAAVGTIVLAAGTGALLAALALPAEARGEAGTLSA